MGVDWAELGTQPCACTYVQADISLLRKQLTAVDRKLHEMRLVERCVSSICYAKPRLDMGAHAAPCSTRAEQCSSGGRACRHT